MKILLAQGTVYVPAWGGANKSNRLLLEDLVERGHDCRVVAPACGAHACRSPEAFRQELAKRKIAFENSESGADIFAYNGVRVTAVTNNRGMVSALVREIPDFDPDWVLVASEDTAQVLLGTALRVRPARVICLARTTLTLPFGPASPIRSPIRTRLLSQTAGIVVVSRYLKNYFQQWAGLESTVLPICPNGPGPFPDFGRFDTGFVTMINPCAYKGISIFLALARALPDVSFAAVPTWGTTEQDHLQLLQGGNVRLLAPSDKIDDILAQTRVLLVPSLWAEAKANMITEAMLRGIPVLASDVGGNGEATLGVDYLLPVTPIKEFVSELDSQMLPSAVVPEQNTEPWLKALQDLLTDRSRYERVSIASRTAAIAANERSTGAPFEEYLMNLNSGAPVAPAYT